jgi:hypothetical protein
VAIDEDLRTRREETCLGHLRAENAHRFDEAIGFFARPRYELVATGEVFDGAARTVAPTRTTRRCSRYTT